MVEYEANLDPVLKALADPARRAMLAALREGPRTVGEIAAPMDMTFAGASKHLGVLERAGLIERRRRGRERLCVLRPEPLKAVEDWLDTYRQFWTERLDALEQALLADKGDTP